VASHDTDSPVLFRRFHSIATGRQVLRPHAALGYRTLRSWLHTVARVDVWLDPKDAQRQEASERVREDTQMTRPNHALQRTRRERRSCNRCLPCAGSLTYIGSLGPLHTHGHFHRIVFLALSSWSLIALFRRLRRQRATSGRWLAFGILAVCGVAVGIWRAFHVEYLIGSRYRIGSFPIPIVFFHLEDGQWVDFPVPEFQASSPSQHSPLHRFGWYCGRQHRHENTHNAA
jgi:hypothetical protein